VQVLLDAAGTQGRLPYIIFAIFNVTSDSTARASTACSACRSASHGSTVRGTSFSASRRSSPCCARPPSTTPSFVPKYRKNEHREIPAVGAIWSIVVCLKPWSRNSRMAVLVISSYAAWREAYGRTTGPLIPEPWSHPCRYWTSRTKPSSSPELHQASAWPLPVRWPPAQPASCSRPAP
jgi:hypothetical protein